MKKSSLLSRLDRYRADYGTEDCSREPVHLNQRIQPMGGLLVLDRAGVCVAKSVNLSQFLHSEPKLREKFPPFLPLLERLPQSPDPPQRSNSVDESVKRNISMCVHCNRQGFVFFEFEPKAEEESKTEALSGLLNLLTTVTSSSDLGEIFCDRMRALTGYDRVMLYRFEPDWHGEIVAESCVDELPERFLGLHFPSTDIPEPARILFQLNPVRVIQDIRSAQIPITSSLVEPLDQTFATLRSVSPVHIEYLTNMGIVAGMSVAVFVKNRFWGLVACHHYSPFSPSVEAREVARAATDMFGLLLSQRHSDDKARAYSEVAALVSSAVSPEAFQEDLAEALGQIAANLQPRFASTGSAVWQGEQFLASGYALPQESLEALLVKNSHRPIFSERQVPGGGGVLAASLSQAERLWLLWFRPPVKETVRWAGRPEKNKKPDGTLSPRNSFAEWVEQVEERSADWTQYDLATAEAVRRELIQTILSYRAGELERTTKELRDSQAKLVRAQKLESIGVLASGIAHDFNNILVGILGHSELLEGHLLPGDAGRSVRVIRETALKARNLTQQLLVYSRGELSPGAPVPLEPLVKSVAELARRTFKKEVEIEERIHSNPFVKCEETRLEQALLNLLLNARDVSSDGDVVTIEAGTASVGDNESLVIPIEAGEYAYIAVRDWGPGISPDHQAVIFDPYFSTKRPGQGTGLGLFSVYGIVKAFHGGLGLESSSSGTTFTIYLPSVEAGPLKTESPSEPPTLKDSLTIVVVDDEPEVSEVLARMLRGLSCECVVAQNGEEALQILKSGEAPDAIILDRYMPVMDGETFLRELSQLKMQHKIILSSGGGPGELLDHPYIRGFLQKPFSFQELKSILLNL